MDDVRIAAELTALAPSVAYPPTPPLVAGVIERIEAHRRRRRRVATIAAAVAIAVLALGLLPGPRQAIARVLGLGGVRIEQVASLELPPATTTAADLGMPSSLEEAETAAGFAPLVPSVEGLGEPDVFVKRAGAFTLVTLRYPAADGSPGLVITEFASDATVFVKQLDETTTLREVPIGDTVGRWMEGGPHTIALSSNGDYLEDTARLVANTLLWAVGNITIRIESELGLDRATEVAVSMVPAGD